MLKHLRLQWNQMGLEHLNISALKCQNSVTKWPMSSFTFNVTVSHWWFHSVCAIWDLPAKDKQSSGNYSFTGIWCCCFVWKQGLGVAATDSHWKQTFLPWAKMSLLTIGAPERWHCPLHLSRLLRPIGCRRCHSGRCPARPLWLEHPRICSSTELCRDTATPIMTKRQEEKLHLCQVQGYKN